MAVETDPLARGRARVERRTEGLRIEIPAKREWFLIGFLLLWVGFIAAAFIGELASDPDSDAIAGVVIGALFWCLGAGLLGWILIGREIVTATGRELVVERRAGPFRSEKRFDRERIERLRLDAYEGAGSFFKRTFSPKAGLEVYGFGGGSIVFDYGARTHRFGSKLDEAESRQLAEQIARELRLEAPALHPERPGSY
jgi:hypothetical protein